MTALTATRTTAGQQVDGGKGETKSKDEKKRAEVTAKLQKVYDGTKKDVETTLSDLDKKVDTAFTAGEKSARDAFTADHKRRMKAYKDKRYSGWTGKARWVKDKFAGLPKEANNLYQEARKLYVAQMRTVISSVADIIGTELGKAKARIAKGRTELKAEVDKLPADLRQFGDEAAKDFAGRFDDLEATVNEKSEQLVQDLASKYTAALNKIDEEIKKLQEANKGLIDKAKDAIVGAIKTINELKNLLLGILAKAAGAIMKIIKDPIGFLGNLVKAVGAGLNLFVTNITEHLKTGVVSWLLGTAVKAGLELPQKFDMKGIIQLIGSLLGLTWANIKARVTRKGVPDEAMAAVETSVPVAKNIAAEGPAGAVKEIQAEAGDLKATILEKLTSYLIPTVIIAGVTWILSLLNPASAFVRAVKGIIDIVTFIVNQGSQIVEFVNSVLDAVVAIANGGSAGVPKMVEAALAASVPLLIGFLASLLGIGSLAGKVKSVFHAVARPVNRAIDKIVDFIAKKARRFRSKPKEEKTNPKPPSGNDGDQRDTDRLTQQQKAKIANDASRDTFKKITSGKNPKDLPQIISSSLEKWKKKGVTSLTIEPAPGGSFLVLAKVNPADESPSFTFDPKKENIQHLMSYSEITVSGKAWATGSIVINETEGKLFGPSKNKPKVSAREEAKVSEIAHAEETVIAIFKSFWEAKEKELKTKGTKPGDVKIKIDLHVGYNCCVKCADYLASFVKELAEAGYAIDTTAKFSTFYQGGNIGGNNPRPATVSESWIDRNRKMVELFLNESDLTPTSERKILLEADPDRYWGRPEDSPGDPKDEEWLKIRRKKDQGLLSLAILQDAKIKVGVLDSSHLSDEKLTDNQKIALKARTDALNDAIEETKKKIEDADSA